MENRAFSLEEFSQIAVENLVNSESGINRFNNLLQHAGLVKELLQITSYESAEFVLKPGHIEQIGNPSIDRLSMISPPSFEFSVNYRIRGYFCVKYRHTNKPLPVKVEAFYVKYSGILVPGENDFDIMNEKIELIRR